MEVDGAPLRRVFVVVHDLAGPVPTGHGARREVRDLAVEAVDGQIASDLRTHFARKIPLSDDVEGEPLRRLGDERFAVRFAQRARGDKRAVDLAVVIEVETGRLLSGHRGEDEGCPVLRHANGDRLFVAAPSAISGTARSGI